MKKEGIRHPGLALGFALLQLGGRYWYEYVKSLFLVLGIYKSSS
jgi:hypothetical protein